MIEKKVIITQSMIKDFYEYYQGNQCGLIFEKKYIDKKYDLFPASVAQAAGNWFEYQCIGATTKSNDIPQPEKTAKGELNALYKRMESHVENFHKFMNFYGIEIVSVQTDLQVGETVIELPNNSTGEISKFTIDGLNGTTDVICKAKFDIKGVQEFFDDFGNLERVEEGFIIIKAGEEFIMDIKTSGLLDDFRSPYGWSPQNLSTKEKIVRQPIHYKYLTELKYGKQYKFLFLLFSQANDYDFRSLLFNIDEVEHINEHKERIVWTDRWVKHNLKKGFKAHPSVVNCHDCPLKGGCKHFEAVPKIKIFDYQPQKI